MKLNYVLPDARASKNQLGASGQWDSSPRFGGDVCIWRRRLLRNGENDKMKLCECGCGQRVSKFGNRFILGHNFKGKKFSPEHCDAISSALTGIPHTPEQLAADEAQLGGHDICNHHYLYDHSDLTKNTVQMTRKDHSRLHRLFQKLNYKVPHINSPDEHGEGVCEEVL